MTTTTWLTFVGLFEIAALTVLGIIATKLSKWYYYPLIFVPLMILKIISYYIPFWLFNIRYYDTESMNKGLFLLLFYTSVSFILLFIYLRITNVSYSRKILKLCLLVYMLLLVFVGYIQIN